MVNAPHQGQALRDSRFKLESQVIEELGVVLPVRALVIAVGGEVAHPFHDTKTQPGLHPQPGPDADDAFSEVLLGGVGVGNGLIERSAGLLVGLVVEQIALDFDRQRSGFPDPLLHRHAREVLRAHSSIEEKRVSEVGVDALSAPDRGSPGVGVPLRDWW